MLSQSTDTCTADSTNNKPLNLDCFINQKNISLEHNDYLERQNRLESNARSYPRRIPLSIARAKGIYIEDTKGNIFIDCLAGAGSLALGHNHPAIHQALKKHLSQDAPLLTLDLSTPTKDEFVSHLFDILPDRFSQQARVQFCSPSGADAVEAAIKLAKTATGRRSILAFSGAYHGMTQGTLSLMGNLSAKSPISNLMAEVQFLPFPYLYRCPFGLSGEASIDANLHYIDNLLSDPESGITAPAAVIVEAIQGEGGVIPAPNRWLQGLRTLTQAHDIPLIMDEVQSGIGRTGKMFAFEHAGITPDIIVISKAIGGGLPLSVLVYKESLDTWQPGAHAGTFRGNQLAMAAGSATLECIQGQRLDLYAQSMGQRLANHLRGIQKNHAHLGNVRGRGLMLGVEIINPRIRQAKQAPPTFPELAAKIQQQCLYKGLILEVGGRHGSTLRFLPPLIASETEIDTIAAIFQQAVKAAIGALDKK